MAEKMSENIERDKRINKKEYLKSLMKEFVSNNIFDVNAFREKYPTEYAMLPYYFGSITFAIEQNGWIKSAKIKTKPATLRNQLAYLALNNLREDKTFEEIAKEFGVTKAAVSQLFAALKEEII